MRGLQIQYSRDNINNKKVEINDLKNIAKYKVLSASQALRSWLPLGLLLGCQGKHSDWPASHFQCYPCIYQAELKYTHLL